MKDANCLYVPASTLAVTAPGEAGEETVAPAVGDPVTVSVQGVVEGMMGDQAKVRVQAIDGKPVPIQPAMPGESDMPVRVEEPTRDEELYLRSQAKAWDELNDD